MELNNSGITKSSLGVNNMNTLLITIVPSILILLYFFLSDRFKTQSSIALVFFLGCFNLSTSRNYQ